MERGRDVTSESQGAKTKRNWASPQGCSHPQQPLSWCSSGFYSLNCPEPFKYPSSFFIWDNLNSFLAKSLKIQLWSKSNQCPFSSTHPFIISSTNLRKCHWRNEARYVRMLKDGPAGWDLRSNEALRNTHDLWFPLCESFQSPAKAVWGVSSPTVGRMWLGVPQTQIQISVPVTFVGAISSFWKLFPQEENRHKAIYSKSWCLVHTKCSINGLHLWSLSSSRGQPCEVMGLHMLRLIRKQNCAALQCSLLWRCEQSHKCHSTLLYPAPQGDWEFLQSELIACIYLYPWEWTATVS